MKRRIWMGIFLVLLLLSSAVLPALAAEELNANGHSYTYTYWKDIVAAPVSYTGAEEIRLPELTDAVSLEDITVSSTGTIYAADSRGNCVYVLSASLSLTDTLREYTFEGETRQLIAPEGVYAGKDRLYVANTGGKNIVIYDYDGSCAGVIEEPPAEELSSTVEYEPIRVCADNGGRVYAIARNQTQGILQFSRDGQFTGYLGATRVTPNVMELFYRAIATEAMLDRMQRFIPTEYNNLTADTDGFIYATIGTVESNDIYAAVQARQSATGIPVRRINAQGNDILKNSGYFPPVGELAFPLYGEYAGPSRFVDVAVSDLGVYSVLDEGRGKVFTYDAEGNLLYIFGGDDGNQPLRQPVSIAYSGDDLIICDKQDGLIRRYVPTAYAQNIRQALRLHEEGRYDDEKAVWEEVRRSYIGSNLAALGLGKAAFNSGDAATALQYFREAESPLYYSKALSLRNRDFCEQNLVWIIPAGAAAVAAAYFLLRAAKKAMAASRNQVVSGIYYANHLIVHPFDGFWDLKHEKKGNMASATLILCAAYVVYVLNTILKPYLFNDKNLNDTNILVEGLASVVVMVAGWVIASWCLTALFDGKGKMRDIYIYTCYSLYPYIILTPVLLAVSHLLTADAAALYQTLSTAVLVYVGFLIVCGTLTTHDYTLSRTAAMVLLSLVGMGIMAFITLLCTNLVVDIYEFLATAAKEAASRLFG